MRCNITKLNKYIVKNLDCKIMENGNFKKSCQTFDIVSLELCQRQIEAELKTKRIQVDQLREQVDSQTIKIHELEKNVYKSKAKVENLEYELELSRRNCNALQAQNRLFVQNKYQQEKMLAETQVLKDLLQKREIENQKLLRQIEDLSSQKNVEAANRKDLLERDFKTKALVGQIETSFKQVEKETHNINALYDYMQKISDANDHINTYKEITKRAIENKENMEEQYLFTKAKLDMLTEMMEKLPLPKYGIEKSDKYKKEISRLREELDEEKELTMKQNKRLADEITLNVRLCFKMDDLEQQLEDFKCRSKNVIEASVQTEEDLHFETDLFFADF